MKKFVLALMALSVSSPALAQFGALDRAINNAAKVKRLADLSISDAEERQIGDQVSTQLIARFGVFQDADVTKYVSLVGSVIAGVSTKPNMQWEFIVLDTDGVNAFAAPGGFVFVTKGLLGLIKNEAELAGVLGHEVIHVTARHSINALKKGNAVSFTADEVSASGGLAQGLVTRLAERAYTDILDNNFSREDEKDSDENGVQLANKVGYAPAGLSSALTKVMERNKDQKEPNGIFASHPAIKERISNIEKVIAGKKLSGTALVAERYGKYITFDAKPITEIAVADMAGASGLAGGDGKSAEPKKEDKPEEKKEEKKRGFGLGSLLSGGSQAPKQSASASAGSRGLGNDRNAAGGTNRTRVPVKIDRAELDEFRKGIA
jgi:Zn-dependent protease with chaperone function